MYYCIEHKTDKEAGNIFPQVGFDNVKEAFKFRHNLYPEAEPILTATLKKRAKLTDILSQASIPGHGLMINEKVKKNLADFKIMSHKYYDCPVKDLKGNTHQYFWLALVQPELINSIDFKESSFYLKKGLKNLGVINLNDYDHYLAIKENLDSSTIVKADSIVLKTIEYDLFKLPLFDSHMYISTKLKEALTDTKGIEINKALF